MTRRSPGQLYKKLFMTYFIIIISIILALEIYFISKIKDQIRESNLTYVKVMHEKATSYILKSSDDSDRLINTLYQSNQELQDLINYLQDDIQIYLEKRLNIYSKSVSASYNSIETFFQKAMQSNDNIGRIGIISYRKEEITYYYPNGITHTAKLYNEFAGNIAPEKLAHAGSFAYVKEIRNPVNLENIGCILMEYKDSGLQEAHKFYPKAELSVFDQFGNAVYNSGGKFNASLWFKDYPNMRTVAAVEKEEKTHIIQQKIGHLYITSYIYSGEVTRMPLFLKFTVIGIGVGLFIISLFFIFYRLKKLTRRLDSILEGMEKVTKGNLSIRLDTGKEEDELDVISEHFNLMCSELDNYIKKSYLLEIEQKNAEMRALQSQINPHFLYNTLESIRMKAICNGDREVGKMLYGLAVIFRSQVKEDNVITIAKELHYCKKYFELFQFRYQKKFSFSIECDSAWMQIPIIKFIIQPVIENYFMHGIRLEDNDNFIHITAEEAESKILIKVSDNGKGIEEEGIVRKNVEMQMEEKSSSGSIGLKNVHDRLRAAYGADYGLFLSKNCYGGLCVTLKIPKEGMQNV